MTIRVPFQPLVLYVRRIQPSSRRHFGRFFCSHALPSASGMGFSRSAAILSSPPPWGRFAPAGWTVMPLADATQTEAPAQRARRHPGAPARAAPGAVRVGAPARLHLGFLDRNGGLGRMFGSIGLAVDVPRTELVLK